MPCLPMTKRGYHVADGTSGRLTGGVEQHGTQPGCLAQGGTELRHCGMMRGGNQNKSTKRFTQSLTFLSSFPPNLCILLHESELMHLLLVH